MNLDGRLVCDVIAVCCGVLLSVINAHLNLLCLATMNCQGSVLQ
jgi:hypothetical protein